VHVKSELSNIKYIPNDYGDKSIGSFLFCPLACIFEISFIKCAGGILFGDDYGMLLWDNNILIKLRNNQHFNYFFFAAERSHYWPF
jgi:hypothetical protein